MQSTLDPQPFATSRPESVHGVAGNPAAVGSIEDTRTCSDVQGQCRIKCGDVEYLRGRFRCEYPSNCCVPR